ncbi:conserved hypothetical protein [Mesorhizobium metallidurans STM 2683]|uniref:DUF982 domain-containing protein n=1 Tax=Mesorhizobium metallidurans STM 2683 TaxID=1297569 RepID=M5EZ64_9HYPH|nr:DUF982 domain-containing protein [Mesorhizobium metallidurans]CCV09477.1 conserved hypothetical protein [Mesorhizobium metallidurans STM 2683]
MRWFCSPVFVRTDQPEGRYGVDHAQEAAEQLLKWSKRGARWHKAMRLCQAVQEGDRIDPQIIRKAFEAAAKESEMLYPSE